jgi:hypothetical protein
MQKEKGSSMADEMEMIDRVGGAIQDAIRTRGSYEHLARAAIAAMREPTEAMLAEGPGEPYMDAHVWARMIDAALGQK